MLAPLARPLASASAGRLATRMFVYTRERFPLHRHAPLVALFTLGAAGFGASGWPGTARAGAAAVAVLTVFFALRVADEHKDAAVDALVHPTRPVPRGLVQLAELRAVAGAALAVGAVLAALLGAAALGAFVLALGVGAAMTAEFGARVWLRARLAAYLATHLTILPALDLFTLTVGAAGDPLPAGWLAPLVMAYAGGGVYEVGRKVRAAADERPGFELYSAAWGLPHALAVWTAFVLAALAALWAATHNAPATLGAGLLAALALATGAAALRHPTPPRVARVEAVSGLYLLGLYAALLAASLR